MHLCLQWFQVSIFSSTHFFKIWLSPSCSNKTKMATAKPPIWGLEMAIHKPTGDITVTTSSFDTVPELTMYLDPDSHLQLEKTINLKKGVYQPQLQKCIYGFMFPMRVNLSPLFYRLLTWHYQNRVDYKTVKNNMD